MFFIENYINRKKCIYDENIKDKQKENKIEKYIVICKHEASIRIKKDIASPGK